MTIQPDIPFAAQVLGTLGTACWCVQLLPQIWQNHRRGHCAGFPALTVAIWAVSEVPFGAYVIIQGHAIPLQLQPQIFGALCLICWGQCLWLTGRWSKLWSVFWVLLVAVGMAVVEFVLIWTLRPGFNAGNELPTRIVWGFAAACLVIGLIPQYLEQFKRGGRNLGFNWVFLSVDIAGALFSFLAMAVRQRFDMYGGILYIIVMALEVGFFVVHGYWWLKARAKARSLSIAFDEYVRQLDEAEGIVHREPTPFWCPLYRALFRRKQGPAKAHLKSTTGSVSVTSIATVADAEKGAMAPLGS